MQLIANILKYTEPILEEQKEVIIQAELSPEDEEVFEQKELARLPSQQEYEEMWNNKMNLQNQTHGQVCGNCIRTVNMTGNPSPKMLYCKWNGVMVVKFQTSCEMFSGRVVKQDA